MQKSLAAQLTAPNAPADPNTIYVFLMPQGTDVVSGGHCCSSYLGYHWDTKIGDVHVPYAVVCDCPSSPGALTPLQNVTTTLLHELVESATDPFSSFDKAYEQTDDDHIIWTVVTGGELADMCQDNHDASMVPPGATYTIERSWSNAAAKAGHQPCVPAKTNDPYFNSFPVLTTVTLANSKHTQTRGIQIPVGQSATIDVKLWSDGPTNGPWTIKARDAKKYLGGSPLLDLSLDKTSGQSGDIVKLTIKVLAKDAILGGEGFILQSDLDGQENLSMGVVVN